MNTSRIVGAVLLIVAGGAAVKFLIWSGLGAELLPCLIPTGVCLGWVVLIGIGCYLLVEG